jgi:hypothetical protein
MSALEKAREAWGPALPNWVEALAIECDRTSQGKTAARIGRSGSLVSNVLGKKYPGDMAAVEETVRGALMGETLMCPVMGEINKKTCRDWRGRSGTFSARNTRAVQMYRACNRCPRNMATEGKADA